MTGGKEMDTLRICSSLKHNDGITFVFNLYTILFATFKKQPTFHFSNVSFFFDDYSQYIFIILRDPLVLMQMN